MPFPAAALIGGGLDLGASALAAYYQRRGVDEQNSANLAVAREQMSFQERMSSTAYTRSVRDMRNAGLNPAVMLQGGGHPASTPGGAGIPMQNRNRDAVTSALEVTRLRKDLAEASSRIALNKAQEHKVKQDTFASGYSVLKTQAETGLIASSAREAGNRLIGSDAEARWIRKYGAAAGFLGGLATQTGFKTNR